jgi:hypothetical protein
MRRWRAVVAALYVTASSVAVAVPAVPAAAHTTDPTIVTRIDAVTPPLPGVTVEVRAGAADQLLVVNTTAQPVEVVATGGEPFLRIGPDVVAANLDSPDWYRANSPQGAARVPATAKAGAKPRWATVARGASWGWFDHRLHDTERSLTPELRGVRRTVRLAGWTVPLRHGGAAVTVSGHVEYRPVLGSFRTVVTDRPRGVEVDALDGRVPGLFLRWDGKGALVVRGIAREPFARLTTNGAEVNDASPTWQEDQRLRGVAPPGVPVDAGATPAWRRTGTSPQLTWLDRRLAYAPGFPPDDVARAGTETTLVEWSVDVDAAGVAGQVRGTTTWVPSGVQEGRDTRRRWTVVVFAGAALAVVLVVLRRRSAR